MAAAIPRQDMPPTGGYKPIPYKRIPARTYFSGPALIAGYFGITAGSCYLYYLNCLSVHREEIERRSAEFALYPMLLAERDRVYMKQLRVNRDAEEELMKNVPGWEVGTLYGKPVYRNLPKDTLIEPGYVEYYAHANYKDFAKRTNLSRWS
ncbi:hypothetical protein PPYR_06476 [Photinus pyralis]|uniref:NADH dehydrogenase [ubiquinone] 1 alpha subcomplex subunit 13 n=1 Tax=Photinus pyralis TaxID=7054 RepID=A0A1Y1NI59_PHOPY|nr:NADH dehydrogenase [ubiquinone] 1 alpha subcomplex subunit 13 [Photinus pyralis]KAB0800737.1 hypothetical protein PPYR_06476 [Photinus pyralis]